MCWVKKKSHILNNVIQEKEIQIDNITNELNNVNIKLDKLINENEKQKQNIEKLEQDKSVDKDKLNELTVDIEDKELLIQQQIDKCESIKEVYDNKIKELESKIKELTPSNTVLFYFPGTNYELDQNSSKNMTIIDTIKSKFKEFFDKIFIRVDPSMYNTLEILKTNSKPRKIPYNKKIITGSFDAIKRELNNGKKVILIGENFGGTVINRIIDTFIKKHKTSFNFKLLDNMYAFTFGSYYTPDRTTIPSDLTEYINNKHIHNYIYANDISAQFIENKPESILHSTWVECPKTLTLWSLSNLNDPWEIHYSYETVENVHKYINNEK